MPRRQVFLKYQPLRTSGCGRAAVRRARREERHRWYVLSHQVVDNLRFGGCPEADTRLAVLLGRVAIGETPAIVVPVLWGKSLKELDAGFREWMEK